MRVKCQGFVVTVEGFFEMAKTVEADTFVGPFPSLKFFQLRRNDHFPGLMQQQRFQVGPYLFEGLVSLLR